MSKRGSAEAPDISVILTAHREGCLIGPTLKSCAEALAYARDKIALTAELVIVLDQADATTRAMVASDLLPDRIVIETDFGDPGQARNAGVAAATGTHSTFLDADDLWSFNWIAEAFAFCRERPDAVAHSEMNMLFGLERNIWWHIDSEGALFDPLYLRWTNYWDAMSFARTDVYRRFPFKANDLRLGFGHEDWHWNCLTLAAGIPHKPVEGTVHFKRRRASSQMSLVAQTRSTVWPLEIDCPRASPDGLGRTASARA